ncbi:MAG: GNAT family N-acetyltransferase [Sedimenticola sp.]
MTLTIRKMEGSDIAKSAVVHREVFKRQNQSLDWMQCNYNAFPKTICFVAEEDDSIVGYIVWSQKGGFRPEVVLELEQIGVLLNKQGRGIGKLLIEDSLLSVRTLLADKGSMLKHIVVTTRSDNYAQDLYKTTLGVKVEATIKDLFSHDEVFMIVRNV